MGISRINNSLSSLTLFNFETNTAPELQRSLERLASGFRINRAADDASGLSTSNRLQSQIAGLNQAFEAAQTGINLANTADQGLNGVSERLNRVRELVVQAGSSTQDQASLQAIQGEIEQNVAEIGRIAETTQFSGQTLLNGSFSAQATVRDDGTQSGVSVTQSSLTTRENFFNIQVVQEGSAQITSGEASGEQQVLNTGIQNQQDVAVTRGTFNNGNNPANAGDALTDLQFNGVQLQNNGTISFQGVLADGQTAISGSVEIDAGTDLNGLAQQIQQTIDAAEEEARVNTADGSSAEETNVAVNETTGRLEFRNGADQGVSEFQVQFTVSDANGTVQNTSESTRAAEINGQATGAQVGNSVTAITGNTFDTGQLSLEVSNVVEANQRTVESNLAINSANGGPATANTNLIGSTINGVTLAAGDTITLNGTNADGSTFTNSITVSNVDLGAGQGDATTVQNLVDELNVRDRSQIAGGTGNQSGFEDATAQLTGDGRIQVRDDVAQTSQTNFTLAINDQSGEFATIVDDAAVTQEGNAQRATVRINEGPAQEVEAGQTVTLFGPTNEPDESEAPQITLTLGEELSNGTDTINVTRETFTGTLNGGEEVQFSAGEQNVTFENGIRNNETVTLNFDAALNVPELEENGLGTVVISASAREANFQIGANAGENTGLTFGDVRPQALGFGEGRSLNDIDVTDEGGVDEALQIVDEALSQVDEARSEVGAFSNGLEATANRLSVASENLVAANSRIADTNFAAETTRNAINQMIFESNILVQSQANNLSNTFFLDLLR